MSLESTLIDLLNQPKEEKVVELVKFLKNKGVRSTDDLRYLTRSVLEESRILNENEIDQIISRKISIREAIDEILSPSSKGRIDEVVEVLQIKGICCSGDLKYLDWNTLKEMKCLTDMEIEKIMRYIKKNFPEEYREHSEKRKEELILKRETELLKNQVKHKTFMANAQTSFANYVDQRDAILKDIDNLQSQHMSLKCPGNNGSSNFFNEKANIFFMINIVTFPIFLIVLIVHFSDMAMEWKVIIVIIQTSSGICLIVLAGLWLKKKNSRQRRLEENRDLLAAIERQLDDKRKQLDEIESQSSQFFK